MNEWKFIEVKKEFKKIIIIVNYYDDNVTNLKINLIAPSNIYGPFENYLHRKYDFQMSNDAYNRGCDKIPDILMINYLFTEQKIKILRVKNAKYFNQTRISSPKFNEGEYNTRIEREY